MTYQSTFNFTSEWGAVSVDSGYPFTFVPTSGQLIYSRDPRITVSKSNGLTTVNIKTDTAVTTLNHPNGHRLVILSPSDKGSDLPADEELDRELDREEVTEDRSLSKATFSLTPLPGDRGYVHPSRGVLYQFDQSKFEKWTVQLSLGSKFFSSAFPMKQYATFTDQLSSDRFSKRIIMLEQKAIHVYGLTPEAPHIELSSTRSRPQGGGLSAPISVAPTSAGVSPGDYLGDSYGYDRLGNLRVILQQTVHPSKIEEILRLVEENPPPPPQRIYEQLDVAAVEELPPSIVDLIQRHTENATQVREIQLQLTTLADQMTLTPSVTQRAKFVCQKEALTEIAEEWLKSITTIKSLIAKLDLSLTSPDDLEKVLTSLLGLVNVSHPDNTSFAALMKSAAQGEFTGVLTLLLQTLEPFRTSFSIVEDPKDGLYKMGVTTSHARAPPVARPLVGGLGAPPAPAQGVRFAQ